MTMLSRKADYALLILSYLHSHPDGGNARTIAEQFNLSRPFVANILKLLCQAGFVSSSRGVNGGYVLRKNASETTLATLLDSIQEGFRLTVCTEHSPPSPRAEDDICSLESGCSIKGPLTEIHRRIMSVLRGVTLGELFSGVVTGATVGSGLLPMLPVVDSPGCCGSVRQACHEPATI
ncbi:RrF2 family transcriptional regulator [Fimbriiglobus ruber]|uniref:Iron-sulfur cluster regulator IscR n=1 Tax=Fimbriiglobus ruber TaxID=1908690 RepID=A0A225DW17_9BACT|nr:Rrf2 family transcriptional regulator [Fimbriiglobus ruber]OWK40505.1 Iron-sulfur cluster regulator IscR [Fimbriiglobus ruber]